MVASVGLRGTPRYFEVPGTCVLRRLCGYVARRETRRTVVAWTPCWILVFLLAIILSFSFTLSFIYRRIPRISFLNYVV